MNAFIQDCAAAFQFLTRVPMPPLGGGPADLSRAAKFFPMVGLVLGLVAGLVHYWLLPHLPSTIVALAIVLVLVLITAGFHEDGLADVADGFGAGWSREQILEILKDSRIGTFGALAVTFSVLARVLLIAALPARGAFASLVCAQVLCRWTVLPLGYALSAARRNEGQGARLAKRISLFSLIFGTLFAVGVSVWLLRSASWVPWLACALVTVLSGLYYRSRIGGVTGDCFGATCQLAEVAVYLCGVWQ